jgi:hypothetical protein
MIFNDGQAFMAPNGNLRAHNVLDNLIYRRRHHAGDDAVAVARSTGLDRPARYRRTFFA